MAEIEKSIKLSIDTGDSIASLGRLRRDLANLFVDLENVEEGSEAFNKLNQQIKNTENAIKRAEGAFGDASDKIKTLSGSGIERATQSFGLLKEGLTNLDFGKFKIGLTGITGGFKALGGAIAATGIGLLITGVSLLIENFDKLKSAGGLVGKVFTAIGDTISFIIDGITELSDAIGLTDTKAAAAQERANERNKKAIEERLDLVNKVKKSYEDQIAVAKAAGKDTTDLENKSAAAQKQVLKTNIAYLENIAKQSSFFADIIEPVLKGQREKLAELDQEVKVRNAERRKEAQDAAKEEQEKRREDLEKRSKDLEFLKEKTVSLTKDTIKQIGLTIQETPLPPFKLDVLTPTEQVQAFFETYKEQIAASLEIGNQFFNAATSLNDLITLNKTKNLQKGSREEEIVLKKSFERGKKISIAQASIAGIQGVINALTAATTIPEPFGTILKVANAASIAVSTAANIAKIRAQKFESTSSATADAGVGGSAGAGGEGGPSITPPVFNLAGQPIGGASNFVGGGTSGQGQQGIKVFVTESDITSTQNKVNVIQGNSLFSSKGG